MLHKSICDKNEEARKPTPQCKRHSGQEVPPWTETLFPPDKRPHEHAFQKKREHAFHCQRLTDHSTCIPGKTRPVRSKLKHHGTASPDSHREINPKELS